MSDNIFGWKLIKEDSKICPICKMEFVYSETLERIRKVKGSPYIKKDGLYSTEKEQVYTGINSYCSIDNNGDKTWYRISETVCSDECAEELLKIDNDNREKESSENKKKASERICKTYFKRFGDKENCLTNVVSVKQHSNGFRVEDIEGNIYSFCKGDYIYKTINKDDLRVLCDDKPNIFK